MYIVISGTIESNKIYIRYKKKHKWKFEMENRDQKI